MRNKEAEQRAKLEEMEKIPPWKKEIMRRRAGEVSQAQSKNVPAAAVAAPEVSFCSKSERGQEVVVVGVVGIRCVWGGAISRSLPRLTSRVGGCAGVRVLLASAGPPLAAERAPERCRGRGRLWHRARAQGRARAEPAGSRSGSGRLCPIGRHACRD